MYQQSGQPPRQCVHIQNPYQRCGTTAQIRSQAAVAHARISRTFVCPQTGVSLAQHRRSVPLWDLRTTGPNALTFTTDSSWRFSADVIWNEVNNLKAAGANKDTFCLDFPGDPATAVDPKVMLSQCNNFNNQKFLTLNF